MNENQSLEGQQQTAGVAQAPQEKLLPQHEVNGLVGAAKQKGREQGYQQAMQELQQQQPQSVGVQPPQPQAMNLSPQTPVGYTPEDVRRIAAEEFAKQQQALMEQARIQQQQAEGARIFNDLQAKFTQAKASNPDIDFGKTIQDFAQTPEILRIASTVDNSPAVLQHLKENPGKIANLRMLPEHFANIEMKKLSDSIKQNEIAAQAPKAPAPLSQIRPSNLGVGSGDSSSPSAMYKGQY